MQSLIIKVILFFFRNGCKTAAKKGNLQLFWPTWMCNCLPTNFLHLFQGWNLLCGTDFPLVAETALMRTACMRNKYGDVALIFHSPSAAGLLWLPSVRLPFCFCLFQHQSRWNLSRLPPEMPLHGLDRSPTPKHIPLFLPDSSG